MKRSSGNIVIVTTDLQYFNASICSGIYSEMLKNRYNVQIHLTFENEEKEKELIHNIIQQRDNIAGLVIFSSFNGTSFYQEILKKINFPCVFADRLIPYLSQCNFVTTDNYGGAKKIGQLLIQKGAKQIACMSMLKDNKISTIEDRINGFRESHIDANHVNCFREELEYNNLIQSMENVLTKWEKSNNYPDAIFATNHLIMNALISNIQQNKKRQAHFQNILLSCFDDLPYFNWVKYPIISAQQPIKDIVFYINHILLSKIKNHENIRNYANIILPAKIIDRTLTP